jgi:uncharacterized protein YutE (UPF0331/DUF86 family)
MSALDRGILADKIARIEKHLLRVADKLPPDPTGLLPATDASDAVILHLWQAVQLVLDLATASCIRLRLGTPATYAEAFLKLSEAGLIPRELAERLGRAAGFRNVVAHEYDTLDMRRVHLAATQGPRDLRSFLQALAAHAGSSP